MAQFVLDWKTAHLDGENTLNDGASAIGVQVETPENADHDSWTLGSVGGESDQLIANCVDEPTVVRTTFDAPVENVTFELLDVDSSYCDWDDRVTIIAKDADGNVVPVEFSGLDYHHYVNGNTLDATGDDGTNNVTVTIAGPIASLEIILDNGSDAAQSGLVGIGDLSFDLAASPLDGYVDGTSGNDVIDSAYDGDPEGDRIDNNDALLSGEAPQDDIVLAGAGDDLVLAGAGDDEIYGDDGQDTLVGGAGDDSIFGGADDDVIYGDDRSDLEPGRESLNWSNGPGFGNDAAAGEFTQNTGTTNVSFRVISETGDAFTGFETDTQQTGGIDSGGEVVDDNSSLYSETQGNAGSAAYQLDFDRPVENIDFRINDIDGDGRVTVYALNAEGERQLINLDAGADLTMFDTDGVVGNDTALGNGEYSPDTDANTSVLVSIPGPITSIVILHDQPGDANSGINITDIYFDPLPEENLDGGDDVIEGGLGDDLIFGQGGDDQISGGAGADEIYGGAGADTITGGNAGDVVDGGSTGDDNDTLDLSNDGPLRIVDQTVDADGNSTSGTVEFLDADGNVTGTMSFAEIENLILPENQGPDARDDQAETDEDTPVTINVLGNDGDPDGDPLSVTTATSPDGDVVINEDGTITFTPSPDFNGSAVITYTVDDGNGGSDAANVVVNVNAANDAPIATDNIYVVSQDEAAGDNDGNAITDDTGSGVDGDVDGDPLTVNSAGGAAAGAVVVGSAGGLFTILADGSVDFDANGDFDTLAEGEEATTTVTYTVSDGNGGTDTANVTFTVVGTNDGPVATDNSYVVGKSEGAGDLDGNVITDDTGAGLDSDVDGDPLTVIAVNGDGGNVGSMVVGDNGGTFLIRPDGTVDFDAGDDFATLGEGESTTTSVTYTISDGNGGTDTGIATFTVTGARDGVVEGTAGDDLIDVDYTGDPDGDFVDNDDAILPGDSGDDDLIFGYDGDDTIIAGDGDDEVNGGADNDSILGGAGSDTVDGGDGDDVIDTSNPGNDALPDQGYPGLYPDDSDPSNDLDSVIGGAGNDIILTGDDDDTIDAGSGNDYVDAGWDDDIIDGGAGNDTLIGNEGNDTIDGGDGDDLIFGGLDDSAPDVINIPDDGSGPFGPDQVTDNNSDVLSGGAGNDTIYGRDDDDTLFGGIGDDLLDGGVDDDLLEGGEGNDTLIGGQGDDTLLGGDGDDVITGGIGNDVQAGGFGSDTFLGGNGGDNVVGGEDVDGNDVDVLDLTGANVDFITYNDADPESGVVTFLDGSTMTFSEIENVIPCFTPGTTIATPKGERLVEDLRVGDRVITRDNGIQEIAWVGQKQLAGTTMSRNPHLKPILIKAGALGQGLPERDMLVSPNHRILVASEITQLYFEEREVLAAAKHMTGAAGIHALDAMATTYIHFMFEQHEVVLSNGAWSESFQPGDYSLKGIGNSQRNEIFELFPELATRKGLTGYQAARKALKKHEARLLLK